MESDGNSLNRKPTNMTAEHKTALAQGRAEGRAVKEYLEALVANRPKRGRKRTPDSIGRRLEKIAADLETSSPLTELQLVQERMDLERELAGMKETANMSGLEDAFVEIAAQYSRRKGISYGAWREVGVTAAVLKRAGIGRGA